MHGRENNVDGTVDALNSEKSFCQKDVLHVDVKENYSVKTAFVLCFNLND